MKLLQEDFVTGFSKLHPADILSAIERDDPRIVWTPEARKLRLLVLINPLHPGNCEGFDGFEIKVECENVVVRASRS